MDILSILTTIAKRKRLVLSITLTGFVSSLVVAFLLPKIYIGTAVLMPPQEDQSTSTLLLGQLLGGSTSGAGIATALGIKNPNDLYVGILESRTIADRLIDRFQLQQLYDADTLVDTRIELAERSTIAAQKDGLIVIAVEDTDPKRAADIANAFVEELDKLTEKLAISNAARRRLYFEKQVAKAKQTLSEADKSLTTTQERSGLIRPDDQAVSIIQTMASLRAQIAAKEVELRAARTFATAENPTILRLQEHLRELRRQLVGLERENAIGGGNILIPTARIPGLAAEYLERIRDVKYAETLYELLAKQLEVARIEEGRNSLVIQVVDVATPPDKRAKPKRTLIVLAATLFSFAIAVLAAAVVDWWNNGKADPSVAGRLRELLNHIG